MSYTTCVVHTACGAVSLCIHTPDGGCLFVCYRLWGSYLSLLHSAAGHSGSRNNDGELSEWNGNVREALLQNGNTLEARYPLVSAQTSEGSDP